MIDLTVKTLDSRNHSFSLEDDITVRGFKEHIAEAVAVPADSQRLIYCGRVLQNDKKLIEYDVNGKVIHLVQRAPPQTGQRGNSGGQGQDQGQGQGQSPDQGQGRNPHRAHFRHARAQVRLPRIDGNAMYLGAMSFPADAETQGVNREQLYNRASYRLELIRRMLGLTNRSMHLLEHPDEATPRERAAASYFQEQLQEPDQEREHQEQDHEREPDDGTFEIGAEVGGGGLAQAASAAINAALSAAGLNNVAAFSSAALSSLTLLGGQSNGGSPSIIHAHIQRNDTEGGESAMPANPNDVNPVEQQQQTAQQQQQTETQPQGQDNETHQQPDAALRANNQPHFPGTSRSRPQMAELGQLIGHLFHTHNRLGPHLERYRDILIPDRAFPTGGGPNSAEEVQRVVNGVSEALHRLSHATHALSDFIIDMNEPPPRTLQSRPYVVQHSALLQAGIPIQVEAHISLHGRNQNVNNNNEGGNTTAPAAGAATANPESTENAEPSNATDAANSPQQPSGQTAEQQQQQQQQQTFGTVFNVPHNVEVLMEVGPEMSGNEQNQQNRNNNNGSPGGISAGIFPWGAAPPPVLMRSLMQMVAGQMARGVATATTPNPGTSASGEQQAANSEATTAVTAATVDGSNSNPGQSTQARGNTGTHPTTSTQTRSTPRPHVFRSNAHHFRYEDTFDPYLSCTSHHIRPPQLATARRNTAPPQQQQATRNSATNAQNQTATSATTLNAGAPTRENTDSTENATPTTLPQAATANLPIVNLLTQILSGVGAQGGQIQTGPGGWTQLFTGGIPIVQSMGANGPNQPGAGMTLIDLLENTPGLGVSTNVGIIGPLRMDHTPNGEDLLFDLVVTVVQNITLEGWEQLRTGHWEPLAGIRRPLRECLEKFYRTTYLPYNQVVDRLISELQPTLTQLLLDDTNARDAPERGVDVPATIERLLRRHFLNILQLLCNNDVDDTQFAQGLLASIKSLQTEACSVLRYSFHGRQLSIETVAQRIVTRLTEGVEPGIRQWIVNSCASHVSSYLSQMTQLPNSEVVPLLVRKTTARPAPPVPLAQQHTVPTARSEPEPMETNVVEERVEEEPLEAVEGATFPGHEAVPPDWVPIIARDGVRQRRQLQVQMQSQGMTDSGVGGFSDAYLGGMPSKRRKLIEQQKPRILLSPTPNHSAVSISMEGLVRESLGRAGIEEVEGAAANVATDAGVRRAFGQAIRGCLHQQPRRQTAPDFPDALRFPNATKCFAKKDDN